MKNYIWIQIGFDSMRKLLLFLQKKKLNQILVREYDHIRFTHLKLDWVPLLYV